MVEEDGLVSVIISDQREVEEAFQQLEKGASNPEHWGVLVDHVIAELVRHSVAGAVMYPDTRGACPTVIRSLTAKLLTMKRLSR